MSGKRILDAIALLRASRNVAINHFAIRFSQVNLYAKTSSLVKTIRGQTAPGFVAASQHFSQTANNATRDSPIPDPRSVPSSNTSSHNGIEQDHHYDRSEQYSTQDAVPNDTLGIKQVEADREPLPDGTIPPSDSPIGADKGDPETFNVRPTTETPQHPVQSGKQGDLQPASSQQSTIPNPTERSMTSEQAMRLQRTYEEQIPEKSAAPPSDDSASEIGPEFAIEQEKDVYYQRESDSSPILSSLPRMKVPKIENDVQGGDSHIPKGINADVYYSGTEEGDKKNEPDEEVLAQLFHTKRASQLLRKAPGAGRPRSFHTHARSLQQPKSEQEDLKNLAADMAKDVQTGTVSLPKWL
jgi:aarF domain-containing kinase